MKITESNVVEQIKKKNEKAISFIIGQYGGLITTIIKRHLSNLQDYEECLDDVLLSVWNHIVSFDPEKNTFKQWVAAIAKYQAIDYQRKQILRQSRQVIVSDVNDTIVKNSRKAGENPIKELDSLLRYDQLAPNAQLAVPRPEHFVPLFIAMGSGSKEINAKLLHREYDLGTLSLLTFEFN